MQPQGNRYEGDSEPGAVLHRAVDVLLAKRGLRVQDLMAVMGVAYRSQYHQIFRRASGPREAEVKALAHAFGMSVSDLMSAAE